jgi:exonuclease III
MMPGSREITEWLYSQWTDACEHGVKYTQDQDPRVLEPATGSSITDNIDNEIDTEPVHLVEEISDTEPETASRGIYQLWDLRGEHQKNFIAAYLNINSLINKYTVVNDMLTKQPVDLICIAETKLDASTPDRQIEAEQYRLFRADRDSNGGGLVVHVRSDLPCRQRQDIKTQGVESIAIEIRLDKDKWLFLNYYRPPNVANNVFTQNMTTCLDKLSGDYDRLVIIGDLNYDLSASDGTKNRTLTDICDIYDLKNLIKNPTCFKNPQNPSLVDVILTQNPKVFKHSGTLETGLSDFHHLIYAVACKHAPPTKARKVTYRSFKTFKEAEFLKDLDAAPYQVGTSFTDVDDQFWFFQTLTKQVLDIHVPVKTRSMKNKQVPFMNRALRKAVMDKARFKSKYNRFPNKHTWNKYRVQRNLVTKLRRKSINAYFDEKCNEVINKKGNFWPVIKPFLTSKGGKSSSELQLLEGDIMQTDPNEVANTMNDYYVNVATKIGRPIGDKSALTDEQFTKHCKSEFQDHPSYINNFR